MALLKHGLEICQFSFNSVGIPFSQFWEQIAKSPKCLLNSIELQPLWHFISGNTHEGELQMNIGRKQSKNSCWIPQKWKTPFFLRLWNVQVWQTLATRHSNCAYNNLSKPSINDMMLYFLLPTFGITKYFFLSSVFFSRSWVKHFFTPFAAFGSLIWLCLMENKPQNVIK